MPYIRNHLSSPLILPAVTKVGDIGSDPVVVFESITLNPGASAPIESEHMAAVRKGNTVLDYLLSQGLIKVTDSENTDPYVQLRTVDSPEPPASLVKEKEEADEKVNRKSKGIDVQSVDLSDDEPKSSTKRKA